MGDSHQPSDLVKITTKEIKKKKKKKVFLTSQKWPMMSPQSGSNSILDQLTHLRAQGIYQSRGVADLATEQSYLLRNHSKYPSTWIIGQNWKIVRTWGNAAWYDKWHMHSCSDDLCCRFVIKFVVYVLQWVFKDDLLQIITWKIIHLHKFVWFYNNKHITIVKFCKFLQIAKRKCQRVLKNVKNLK